ncbi:MAG: hypothetical protein HETSPECPRED_004597 [Heterodermia speciosa]|uniref:AAA+ ATPase domain-containing protein n=1 Tax=Heterodermia speciosa TaxID=116794 RepID=A0A8H3J741_9LECA|nr:MAG: hypothetical protein HETSPECPRED_004597 [Heterodermia speciosa]
MDPLENFDFDAFLLNEETVHDQSKTTLVSDPLHTISEDLADGKLNQKDKALKILVNADRFSVLQRDKVPPNKGMDPSEREDDSLQTLLDPVVASAPHVVSPSEAVHSTKETATLSASMVVAQAESDSPVSALKYERRPSGRSHAEEEDYSYDLTGEQTHGGEDEEHVSQKPADRNPFGRPPETCSVDDGRDRNSGKRKVIRELSNGEHHPKRIRTDSQGRGRAPELLFSQSDSDLVKTIYMIHCPNQWADYHKAIAYADLPSFTSTRSTSRQKKSKLSHLNGTLPIHDLLSFFKDEDDSAAIIVVRHIRCEENQELPLVQSQSVRWHESFAVKSSTLRHSIARVAQCYYNRRELKELGYDGINSHLERMTIAPVRLFFFHHQQRLLDYAKKHPSAREHLSALIDYCQGKYAADFDDAHRLILAGLISQTHLEKLYLPNSIVVGHEDGLMRCFVVSAWPEQGSSGHLTVKCWAWKNNGTRWCRDLRTIDVPPIKAREVAVSSLCLYPIRFASVESRSMLLERGSKLWKLKNPSYRSYTGYDVQGEDYYPESRFMIDYSIYKKMHEYASALRITPTMLYNCDTWSEHLDPEKTPSEADLLIMPHIVHGFYLTEKIWVCIFVDGVHEISWNKAAYDRLVINDDTKKLIRALVTVRTSQRGIKHGLGVAGKRVDIIAGKGNGLIMLLHGGPGTGKSLTAESVAEIAEMPLYRVTCGDIGTTPEAVEKYMGLVMHLGVTWNCVLLLDEADVFLEERSMSDLSRNSLVSVFLRILEYYDGILILTSNRIGTFDEAFKSRIQVALYYEKLTVPSRKKVWNNFVDMLEEDEEDVDFEDIRDHLDQLAKIDLNGRQIRNTLTTARQLAIYQANRLNWKHIEQALAVSLDFSKYLQKVQGYTDDQKARDEKLR